MNVQQITHSFQIFRDGLRPLLHLVQPEVEAHDTPTPKNPTLETNMM